MPQLVAAKLSEALQVSLDYLVDNSDVKFDKETINRIFKLQAPDDDEKIIIFKIVDAFIRDTKRKKLRDRTQLGKIHSAIMVACEPSRVG